MAKSNNFDLFVPFCHRSLLGRFVSHPKKASRKVKQICFMKIFYEMISGPHLCYALHRVRVCLLSFLHFSAMRFASLYRRERPLSCLGLESEKQAQAIERIVPRAFARTTIKW